MATHRQVMYLKSSNLNISYNIAGIVTPKVNKASNMRHRIIQDADSSFLPLNPKGTHCEAQHTEHPCHVQQCRRSA